MSIVDTRPLPTRGRRPKPRYVPPLPCNHKYGEMTTLEAALGLKPKRGRSELKTQVQMCENCGQVVGLVW